jgi:uncharacterized SAM-binding protein YcdF (DUF218 family)
MKKIELAKIIWDYSHMNSRLEKADCILVLGSHDTRVAERGAELFLENYGDSLIFSGGLGRLTDGMWDRAEAEIFSEIAVKMGVPENKIIIENKSTNTGENILFTRRILEERNLNFNKFIVVQKPYMERRAYATFKKRWPEKHIMITSPQLSFEEYCNSSKVEDINMEEVINIMVGDLQRIKVYAEKGFQIYQEIPGYVWSAFQQLVDMGYRKYLIE